MELNKAINKLTEATDRNTESDGHFTIMKFSTGYKVLMITPELCHADYIALATLDQKDTMEEAIEEALERGIMSKEEYESHVLEFESTLD